ncbi:PilN domain-containing protein [Pseudomonas putida]
MLRLNLLPWRERQRLATLRRFRLMLVGSAFLALCAVLLVDQLARQRAEQHALANASRQAALTELDQQLEQLAEARATLTTVQAQIQALADLRAQQGLVLELFADLERALPVGVQLTGLKLEEGRLQVVGLAASGAAIAQLMRGLERSGALLRLELKRMKSQPAGDEFVLTARVSASWS